MLFIMDNFVKNTGPYDVSSNRKFNQHMLINGGGMDILANN